MLTNHARGWWAAGCAVLLFLVPVALYFGWCWGWWGRGSLWLQYLLQCNCPAASEQSRYPDSVEVIVSACQQRLVELSPGGRYLAVKSSAPAASYFLDFPSSVIVDAPSLANSSFVTDDLLLFPSPTPEYYLLDWQAKAQIEIVRLWPFRVPGGQSEDGVPDPTVLLPLLQSTEKLHLLWGRLVVLDGRLGPESEDRNYLIEEPVWLDGSRDGELLRAFLEEHNIEYHERSGRVGLDWPSHTGTFVARADGIYLVETGEQISEMYSPSKGLFTIAGWVFDDRGVVLDGGGVYLMRFTLFEADMRFGFVRQPVLMLKVPPRYQR